LKIELGTCRTSLYSIHRLKLFLQINHLKIDLFSIDKVILYIYIHFLNVLFEYLLL